MTSDSSQPITKNDVLQLTYKASWKCIDTIRDYFNGHGKRLDVIEFEILADRAIYTLRGSYEGLSTSFESLTRRSLILFNKYWDARESHEEARKGRDEAIARKEEALFQHFERMTRAQMEMDKSTKELDLLSRDIVHFAETGVKTALGNVEKPSENASR